MLGKVKLALRITTDAFDTEINDLIDAACGDLGIVGVSAGYETTDPLLTRAIITYCKVHFGEPDEYERLKKSYDEQKAQLISATGYGIDG
jgi:hypothetical protein